MSLSYEPPVKITLSTPFDICDEIWACAIQYAQEAGFKTNPIVTTTLWVGFLISQRAELEKNGILDDVKDCFVHSLSHIYGIGLNQVELLADIKQKMNVLWDTLSKDMGDLSNPLEVLVLMDIVDSVNAQFGSKAEGMALQECSEHFRKMRNLLSMRVYHILRKTENDMLLEFKDPRSQWAPVNQRTSTQATQEPVIESKSYSKYVGIIIAILIGVIAIGIFRNDNPMPEKITTPTETQVLLEPKARPSSGVMVTSNMSNGVAPFGVFAPDDYDCLCVLRSTSNSAKLTKFYVRAGRSYEILVPLGTYEMYHATGKDWYGLDHLFGEDTVYTKCDDLFEFTEDETGYSGWTVELQRQSGGNLDSHRVDAKDFP